MPGRLSDHIATIKAGIVGLRAYEMKASIHCSKINSLLSSFLGLSPYLDYKALKKLKTSSKKKKKALSKFNNCLKEFSELCKACSGQTNAEYILGNSIKNIFDKFFTIRQVAIMSLTKLGIPEAANLFSISPEILCNQNQVDIKRLYCMLIQLRSHRMFHESPVFAEKLNKRLNSISGHGFAAEQADSDVIFIPKTNNYLIDHSQLIFLQAIGKGKSARVSLGKIQGSEELVAIKVLQSRFLNPIDQESLKREVSILTTLHHQSLLNLRGYTNEQPFCLITDYCSNGSLHGVLMERPEFLSPTERTIVALDISSGMAYMHEQRVMHRDLKSLNILLDEQKRAKVCDFGLARLKTYEPTTGLIGTPQWMAPEVFMSSPSYDFKVDVYSFGMVLWELLTNEVPFDGYNNADLPSLVVKEGLRPTIPQNTPPDLAQLIKSCWELDPTKRPSFQQITQLLSNQQYMFPGTDPNMVPKFNVRHTSASDPLKLPAAVALELQKNSSSQNLKQNLKLIDTNMIMIYDAIQKNNGEKLNRSIAAIREYYRQAHEIPNPQQFIQELIGIIKDFPKQPAVMRLLSDSFYVQVFFEAFLNANGVEFLISLLEKRDVQVMENVLALLEANIRFDLFQVPMLRLLLSFYNFPEIRIRAKSLSVLLAVAEKQRVFLSTMPSFVKHLLDFASYQLPNELLLRLFIIANDLINLIQELPSSVISVCVQILCHSSQDMFPYIVKVIEATMRFPKMMEKFPPVIWEEATRNFQICKSFFKAFLSKPPKNAKAMVDALTNIARRDSDALVVLHEFAGKEIYAAYILPNLPIKNRRDDQILIKVYAKLSLYFPEVIYKMDEFYSVCYSCLTQSYDEIICQLLRNDHIDIDIALQYGFFDTFTRAIYSMVNPDILWCLLSVIHKWNGIKFYPASTSLIPRLNMFLRDQVGSTRQGAFICLIQFAEHVPDRVQMGDLLIAAMFYINQSNDPIRKTAYEFIKAHKSELHDQLIECTHVFLKYVSTSDTNVYPHKVAKALKALDKKRIIPQEEMLRLTELAGK